MLEKNSSVVLTKDDLDLYNAGKVSDRLRDNWNLTYDDLRKIVESNNYTLVENNNG